MDTNVTARLVPCNTIPSDDLSKYLILVLIFLTLAFIVGLLIILLSRKSSKISERPPVLGAETEDKTETSQNVDMSVPGAEDLTLTQEDISVQPVPQLGHPDDEGVPVPRYDKEVNALVVDTDVAPVDVNADVPIAPVPAETGEPDSSVFVWHAPEMTPATEDTTMNTTTPEPTPENLDTTTPKETMPETAEPETAAPETEAPMPEAENIAAENVMPEPENMQDSPSSPLDNLRAKIEEVKDKTIEFLGGEGENAPLERIKRAALEAKDKAEEKATELKEKAHEIATSEQAQDIRNSLEAKAEEAKEKAAELWEKAKESAEDEDSLIGQAKRKAQDLKEKAEGYLNKGNPRENPEEVQ